MHNELELLLKLQIIDYDLGELERSKAYLPDMIDTLEREMQESKSKLETAKQSFEEARVRQKQLELDIKSKEADLQKYQQQMMSIKTNKEYDALVASIDAIKAFVSEKETLLLQTIDLSSNSEKEIEALLEREVSIRENNTKQLQILREKVDSIGSKVSNKESNRQEIVSTIPRAAFSTYERVRRGKGGRVVNAVKKRACGACFKALTPKKVQEIKRADRIHTCDNCGSLLYWEEAESN
ncbi:MAG: C4-type zinc ribbon domain-containing protein [candidate division Zixibacteria bacterium]|nr:C4-type zinc ribbon domain-containing protein [candidate division Zixibacteria bacterium]